MQLPKPWAGRQLQWGPGVAFLVVAVLAGCVSTRWSRQWILLLRAGKEKRTPSFPPMVFRGDKTTPFHDSGKETHSVPGALVFPAKNCSLQAHNDVNGVE